MIGQLMSSFLFQLHYVGVTWSSLFCVGFFFSTTSNKIHLLVLSMYYLKTLRHCFCNRYEIFDSTQTLNIFISLLGSPFLALSLSYRHTKKRTVSLRHRCWNIKTKVDIFNYLNHQMLRKPRAIIVFDFNSIIVIWHISLILTESLIYSQN